MNIERPSEEQRFVVDSFRQFLRSEIEPIARSYRDRPIPKERLLDITQGIAEFGLPGASVAKAQGGLGLSLVTEAMLFEELAAVSLDIAWCVMTNKLAAAVLAALPEAQAHLRDRYLADLLAGRLFAGFCLGADHGAATITATADGDQLVLVGEGGAVANGCFSDFLIVAAGAATYLLVDRREHGYHTRHQERIALNELFSATVSFAGERVPSSQLIWTDGEAPGRRQQCRERLQAGTGMLAVGLMRAALDATLQYAGQPGRSGHCPAAEPLVAARLAEMATGLDAARLLCLRTFSLMEADLPCSAPAAMAKWFAGELAVKVCHAAVQVHGGEGLNKESDVERLLRESIVLPLSDGATEWHKLQIARALTGIEARLY